jgi:hypothetical protein
MFKVLIMTTDHKKYFSASYHPSGEYCFKYTLDGINYHLTVEPRGKNYASTLIKFVPINGACDPIFANNFERFYRTEILTKKAYDEIVTDFKALLLERFIVDNDIGGYTTYYKPFKG